MVCSRPEGSPLRRIFVCSLVAFLASAVWLTLRKPSPEAPKPPPSPPSPPATAAGSTNPPHAAPNGPPPAPPNNPTPPQPLVIDLGAGQYSVGLVKMNRKSREITIPASVNMTEGPVEYILVGRNGKVHEAVFTTDAEARDIHVAALLLGVKPQGDLGPANSATVVRGQGAVVLLAEWERNGPTESAFLNETVHLSDPSTGKIAGTLPSGAWLYNGSRIEADGVFAATRHASIISIIRDDDSLINNPGASRDNDEIHTPNASKLPPKGHPVRIILKVR